MDTLTGSTLPLDHPLIPTIVFTWNKGEIKIQLDTGAGRPGLPPKHPLLLPPHNLLPLKPHWTCFYNFTLSFCFVVTTVFGICRQINCFIGAFLNCWLSVFILCYSLWFWVNVLCFVYSEICSNKNKIMSLVVIRIRSSITVGACHTW